MEKSLINKDMPLACLTIKQFEELLDNYCIKLKQQVGEKPTEGKKLLKGISELAAFLGISNSSAQRLKSTGILIPATMQTGRTIIFDGEIVLELLKSRSAVLRYKKSKK